MFLTRDHLQPPQFAVLNNLNIPIELLIRRNNIAFLASLGIFRHNTPPDPAPLGYTDWVVETDSDGDLYTRVPAGTPEEIAAALALLNVRWISNADFIRRIPTTIWDKINETTLTNMTVQRLKDEMITGDVRMPGNIDLNSKELSNGIDYLISLGLLTPDLKALLLQ